MSSNMDCSLEFGDGEAIIKVLSKVLNKLIEVNLKSNNEQSIVTKFQSSYAPEISVLGYLERIRKYARCSDACFIVALIYIDRIIEIRNVILTALNIHRILITSVLISAKFFDDEFFNNAFFAKLGGVSIWEMNSLELEFLHLVNFTLFVTSDTYDRYHMELRKYIPVDLALYSPIADYLTLNSTPLLYTSPPKQHVYKNGNVPIEGFLQRSSSSSPTCGVTSKRWKPSELISDEINDVNVHGGSRKCFDGDTSMTSSPVIATSLHHHQPWSDHVMAASQAIILSPSLLQRCSTTSSSVSPLLTHTSDPSPSTPSQQHQGLHSSLSSPDSEDGNRFEQIIYEYPVDYQMKPPAAVVTTTTTSSVAYTTPSKVITTASTHSLPSTTTTTTNHNNRNSSFPRPSLWAAPPQTTTPAAQPSHSHYSYPSSKTIHPKNTPCYPPHPTIPPPVLIPRDYMASFPLTLTRLTVYPSQQEGYVYCYPSSATATMTLNNPSCNYQPLSYPRIDIPPIFNDYDNTPSKSCCVSSSPSTTTSLYSPNSVYYENIHNGNAGAMPIPLTVGASEQ